MNDIKSKLAIHEGNKLIKNSFAPYNSIGKEEIVAANEVLESGVLSKFLGGNHPDFYGGKKVKEFESDCENYFKVKHAITVNSWTSGLIAAIGALDINPGDEIIVSPWTMCASATAILHWNAIPVFADIEKDTFCIDPESIKKNISPRTKAIMAIDIFGQSCDVHAINKIAEEYNLKVISDSAQSPGAKYDDKFAGTLSDIGGYSLNYHKHINTGEGGILVTNDDNLAERMRLIRNHAEAVVSNNKNNLTNMIGHNFRLGEIECAIGIEQLKKLDSIIRQRQEKARKLIEGLSGLKGLHLPKFREKSTHVFYILPMILDLEIINTSREKIVEALEAEGLDGVINGYTNIHLLPIYQQKIAYGKYGFPWISEFTDREINYNKGICPVAEELHDHTFLGFEICRFQLSDKELQLVIDVFHKVWNNLIKK